ncbi:TetR family transcriptional regulator (plasmid) [Paracoccus sp. TD-10]|uniref:TetR family transcriptional regulator n=1 Tax=Paracoccus sp. TD-10 TaxID=3395918 RepID=UPI003AAC66E0
MTTGAVASQIGVTQAALFRHFPTKDALWQAVAEHVAEGLALAWDGGLEPRRRAACPAACADRRAVRADRRHPRPADAAVFA